MRITTSQNAFFWHQAHNVERIEMERKTILEAVKKLRENEKRKFEQTIDLIVNLKNFDVKRETVNVFLNLPHKIRKAKAAAFLTKKSSVIDTITKADFERFKDKKVIKKLVGSYDFFIAVAALMPAVASSFGRYLGTAGKMPSPQLGIIRTEDEAEIKSTIQKFESCARVKSKEPSLKFAVAKENMKDEEIVENILFAYNNLMNALPKKNENIKNVMVKLSMSKPIKIEEKGDEK